MLSKFFQLIKSRQHELFLGSCIVLIAVISYNLGQINSLKKTPISVKESAGLKADIYNATNNEQPTTNNLKTQNSKPQSPAQNGRGSLNKVERQKLDTRVVVSKNSDKYHYSWCSGAKRIKPENQIWFNSAQEAEAKGYVLAGNCAK